MKEMFLYIVLVILVSFLVTIIYNLLKKAPEEKEEKEEVLFDKKIDEADTDGKIELLYYELVRLNKDFEKLKKHFIKDKDEPPPPKEKPEPGGLSVFLVVLVISFLIAVFIVYKLNYE